MFLEIWNFIKFKAFNLLSPAAKLFLRSNIQLNVV
jgi:hypothetical protein